MGPNSSTTMLEVSRGATVTLAASSGAVRAGLSPCSKTTNYITRTVEGMVSVNTAPCTIISYLGFKGPRAPRVL